MPACETQQSLQTFTVFYFVFLSLIMSGPNLVVPVDQQLHLLFAFFFLTPSVSRLYVYPHLYLRDRGLHLCFADCTNLQRETKKKAANLSILILMCSFIFMFTCSRLHVYMSARLHCQLRSREVESNRTRGGLNRAST